MEFEFNSNFNINPQIAQQNQHRGTIVGGKD